MQIRPEPHSGYPERARALLGKQVTASATLAARSTPGGRAGTSRQRRLRSAGGNSCGSKARRPHQFSTMWLEPVDTPRSERGAARRAGANPAMVTLSPHRLPARSPGSQPGEARAALVGATTREWWNSRHRRLKPGRRKAWACKSPLPHLLAGVAQPAEAPDLKSGPVGVRFPPSAPTGD